MAKRVVQECDLTKLEYDPAETVTLVIKKNGKKAGRTYELSPAAAEKLEQQLVAGKPLSPEWTFGSSRAATQPKRTIEEMDENDKLIAEKKRQLIAEGGTLEPREKEEGQAGLPGLDADGSCMHINRGRVQTTLRGGERSFYRVCVDCSRRIPEKTKEQKSGYMNSTAPAGSREDYKEGN